MDVLASASDADYDALTVTSLGTPAHGTVVNNSDGTVTYTPTSSTYSSDSFSYTISDGYGGTATATVSLYIANRAPTAVNASMSHATVAVTVNVLAGDSDPDGDALTVTAVGTPAHGTATIGSGGNVTYTPTGGTTASTDSFSYTISDGHGGSATATVSVYLANRAPTAGTVGVTTHDAITFSALSSASDPDSDSLTVTSVGTPFSGGTATLNGNGTVTYTPGAGMLGSIPTTDHFTYTISDGHGGTATGTVSVTITNQVPDAVNDYATVAASSAVTVSVLANDSDPDGDTLTIQTAGTAFYGSVHINSNGTITYTPYFGTTATSDSFTYIISDGYGGYATATVFIDITH